MRTNDGYAAFGIATKIVRSQSGEVQSGRILLHNLPDDPFGHAVAPVLARATHASENPATGQTGCRSPDIDGGLHPLWHRYGSNVPTLADPIHYGPVFLAFAVDAGSPSRPTHGAGARIKQNGKDCTVSFAFERIWIGCLPEATSVFSRKPIPKSYTQLLDAFHTSDSCRQLGAEQASVGGFVGEAPNGSESSVNRSRREMTILKVNSVPGDDSLVERQSRFGAVPLNELIDCVSVPRFDSGERRLSRRAALL